MLVMNYTFKDVVTFIISKGNLIDIIVQNVCSIILTNFFEVYNEGFKEIDSVQVSLMVSSAQFAFIFIKLIKNHLETLN